MARVTRKEVLAQRQNPAEPYLFDDEQMPMRPDVLTAVKERRYQHTGARLLDDEQMALSLVEKLCLGWGLKRISTALHVSKHTVRAARDELVVQGKLAPYKERVVRIFEEIVERGAQNYLTALEDGTVPAAQIPVGIGIISDKRALALGEPTAIAVGSGPVQDLSVEKLNAWFEGLKPLEVETLDSQSTGKEEKQHE